MNALYCPICGEQMIKTEQGFFCTSGDMSLSENLEKSWLSQVYFEEDCLPSKLLSICIKFYVLSFIWLQSDADSSLWTFL